MTSQTDGPYGIALADQPTTDRCARCATAVDIAPVAAVDDGQVICPSCAPPGMADALHGLELIHRAIDGNQLPLSAAEGVGSALRVMADRAERSATAGIRKLTITMEHGRTALALAYLHGAGQDAAAWELAVTLTPEELVAVLFAAVHYARLFLALSLNDTSTGAIGERSLVQRTLTEMILTLADHENRSLGPGADGGTR